MATVQPTEGSRADSGDPWSTYNAADFMAFDPSHIVSWGPGDIVPADPTDVRRSEFDALKREVEALRAAPTDALGDLVTTFRAYAILKTQQSEEQRRAGHEVDGLVWEMAATCWTAAADELEALLKTTE